MSPLYTLLTQFFLPVIKKKKRLELLDILVFQFLHLPRFLLNLITDTPQSTVERAFVMDARSQKFKVLIYSAARLAAWRIVVGREYLPG